MRRIQLTQGARLDIKRILRQSSDDFGDVVRDRYKKLLDKAICDIAADPARYGVKEIDDVLQGYRVYHITRSKKNISGETIRRPRHLIVFSVQRDTSIMVVAVVHERELIEKHLRGI